MRERETEQSHSIEMKNIVLHSKTLRNPLPTRRDLIIFLHVKRTSFWPAHNCTICNYSLPKILCTIKHGFMIIYCKPQRSEQSKEIEM